SELIEQPPNIVLVLAALSDLRVTRVGGEVRLTDIRTNPFGECVPDSFLHDDVKIVVGSAGLALDCVAELPAAGIVAGSWGLGKSFGRHGILRQSSVRQALMIP